LFERCAIDVLRSTRNITQAREILRLSWDAVQAIQERAVQRGLSRRRIQKLRHLGIDEKSLAKRHRYVSLLIDIDHPRVLEVTPGRDQASADALWNTLPTRQKNQIQAVAMDMWEPYMTSVQENVPQADIVHDKFHVATYLGKAVDTVRKKEHRQLQKEGEETLKGTKYLWLTTPTNWSELQREQFALLQQDHLRVGRAWAIKEAFRHFWNYSYRGAAKTFFRRWFFWATHSRLPPVVDTARTLKRHLTGLLAYTKHRITNATAEGFNSLIQLIKSAARGFRNFNHYRVAILFHCGDLKLHP
jgi:transposase